MTKHDDKKVRGGRLHKGYLTYPIYAKDINSLHLEGALSYTHDAIVYDVKFDGKRLQDRYVTKRFGEFLKTLGYKIVEKKMRVGRGKKELEISVDNKLIKIPAEIRKTSVRNDGYDIQVRISADTHEELMTYIEGIENKLAKWNKKPKKCVWVQSDWEKKTETEKKEKIDLAIQKEIDRLKNKVEDLEDQVAGQRKTQLRNTMLEDYKVKAGVFR